MGSLFFVTDINSFNHILSELKIKKLGSEIETLKYQIDVLTEAIKKD